MKTPKPLYKKPLFWLPVILLALLATPSAIKIFELYIYSPQQEPAPEDFYIREEDPPFMGMTPAPKEDVEIYTNEEGKTVVEAHRDGYTLVLDPSLHVYTRELEGGDVHVSNDEGCQAIILKEPFKTAQESHDYSIDNIIEGGVLELLDDSLEKMEDAELNAYLGIEETDGFGIEKEIIIEANGITYSISNAPHDCTLRDQILAGFSFVKDEPPTDWSFYNNDEYGFRIPYPGNWIYAGTTTNSPHDIEIYPYFPFLSVFYSSSGNLGLDMDSNDQSLSINILNNKKGLSLYEYATETSNNQSYEVCPQTQKTIKIKYGQEIYLQKECFISDGDGGDHYIFYAPLNETKILSVWMFSLSDEMDSENSKLLESIATELELFN